jgi:AraC-like DNA-binding protein
MTIHFQDFILLLGGFISLLIAIAVWLKNKRKHHTANLFLALFLLNCFFSILFKYLYFNQLLDLYPHLLKLAHPLGLLRPVCFYLYFYYLFRPKTSFLKQHWWHFLPTVLLLIYSLPFYVLDTQAKLAVLRQTKPDPAPTSLIFVGFTFGLALVYLWLSLAEWRRFERDTPTKTPLVKAHSRWLLSMLVGYGLFLISATLTWFFPNVEYLSYQIISIFLIVGCIKLLSQSDFTTYETSPIKYAKSNWQDEEKRHTALKMNELMHQQKLYLTDNLRLKDVADKLNIHENQLSQLINEQEQMSFNDYINKFRIEAAQKLLLSEDFTRLTVEAIGYEVGFGTRASFYNAFKKHTGQSPTEFRKKNRKKIV